MTTVDATASEDVHADTGGSLALAALLTGTLLGTLTNNIVNVPLGEILSDFDAPLEDGVLVAVAFLLTFASSMPLAGYLGDRFGRRRVYCTALLATAVCSAGAATAPTLHVLIGWRALGGVAAAAFAPAVMGLIAWLFGPKRRARAIGAWASVNGIGQAIGPSMGGLIAGQWGWRWVFVPLIPVAVVGFLTTLRWIPRHPSRHMRLDRVGAALLTFGSAALVVSLTMVAQPRVALVVVVGLAASGMACIAGFVVHCLRVEIPFVDIRLVAEPRFGRSTVASFAQMFALSVTLLAVPLFLVGHGSSTTTAGLVLFALPAVMALMAPLTGRVSTSFGFRPIMRIGLGTLGAAMIAVPAALVWANQYWVIVVALTLTGVGVALVQTPAAAGSTRSPAGAAGTGLGLFNLIRFGGAAVGASWVAIALSGTQAGLDALESHAYVLLFGVCAAVVVAALGCSYLGRDPSDSPV